MGNVVYKKVLKLLIQINLLILYFMRKCALISTIRYVKLK